MLRCLTRVLTEVFASFVEYNVNANTQVLETVMELGREKPLLADYMFRLKSKTDSLSRYKLARV